MWSWSCRRAGKHTRRRNNWRRERCCYRMGVCYHAHARFLDPHRNRITVPAPSDPATPEARWWYDVIAAQAHELKKVGFTAIMYPPVSKTAGGNGPGADGYGVFDQYDLGSKRQCGSLETRFGTREQ